MEETNEQLDKKLPVYCITCLDNLYSPLDSIAIEALHFRSDQGAKAYARERAEKDGWHSWEITCNGRKVYFINTNTGQEWPKK